MVETDLLPFLTTTSTFIIVTMATLFFCCWRRKSISDSEGGDIKGEKASKVADVKAGDNSINQADQTDQKAVDNGSVSDKSSGFVDTNEELGDFSAVQREQEILKSYRKPPPPKNRARQSRAPRGLTRSTENLDIFAELIEEDNVWDSENKENKREGLQEKDRQLVSGKEVKSDMIDGDAILRPKLEGKDMKRDTRSSMLADIELTLAALHNHDDVDSEVQTASEASTRESPDKDSHSQEKFKETESDEMLQKSKEPPIDIIETKSAPVLVSEPQSSIDSPKKSPRTGPPVSPKPKQRKVLSSVQPKLTTQTDLTHNLNNQGISLENKNDSDLATNDQVRDKAHPPAVPTMPSVEVPSSDMQNSLAAVDPKVDVNSITIPIPKDFSKNKDIQIQDSGNTIGASETNITRETAAMEEKEKPAKDISETESTSNSNQTYHTTEKSQEPETQTLQDESAVKSSDDSPTDKMEASETSLSEESVPKLPSENIEETEQESGQEEQQERQMRMRRESSEGKGKVSRIPVRAGSKPRTSPPKTDTDKS